MLQQDWQDCWIWGYLHYEKIRLRSRATGFLTYDSLICCCFKVYD